MFFRVLQILIFCGILPHHAPAQYNHIENLKFENYTPRNGLPSDYIESITQDKYGFIWLGTHNGLIRFDGVQFKTYLHNSADSSSLPDNDTRSIIADSTGKVWIASRKGLFYYNYAQDDFIKITALIKGQSISYASCPVNGNKYNLWFYCNAGICRLDCKTLLITVMPVNGLTAFPYSTGRLFSTSTGNIYFINKNEMYFFDPGSNSFQKQIIINYDGLLFKEGIANIFEEDNTHLWIASFSGLYLLNTADKTIQQIPYVYENKTDKNIIINSFSYCTAFTGDSILWCSTPHHGLVLLNIKTKRFIKNFLKDNYDAGSIGGSLCYNSFTDRNGIFWVSHINGLSKLDWHNQQIKSYRIKEMADSNEMVPPIRKIIPDRTLPENFWLVTWGYGVLYYNKNTNKIIRRYQSLQNKKTSSIRLSYDGIYDDNGTLWVGTDIGLCYYNPKLNSFLQVKPTETLQNGDAVIERIIKDKNNNLWLGTDAGLWKFNILQNKFQKYQAINMQDSTIVNSSVYAMHFDNTGKLYLGTTKGLFTLDTATRKITTMLRPVYNNTTNFNINYIWGLDVDNANNLWVSARGGGIYKYNPVNKIYSDYKSENGLTTEELRDIFVDSLQNIWVSSYDGIFKLDQKTKVFTRFTPEDGLDNFNISLGRWSIIDNKIYSGSPGAFSIIDPYTNKSLTNRFPVWITGIKILNRFVHFNPDSAEKITVPVNYTENIISFEFTAINYTASPKIKYAYMLEGFDKDWHFSENQHFANYNNLAGGHYTFKVKAMNAEGLWSGSMAYVNINVKPPFWDTWWFRLLFTVTIAGMITFLVKKRIANIRKQAAYKQQQAVFGQKLAETEMMALRAQMNPHFIFNCMNIVDSLITDSRKEEAQGFLQKFSKLIRLVLENSQHQQVSLQQDLKALKLYIELEAIRSNNNFKYNIEVDERLVESNYQIPPLLLQPYVENAIVHGLRNKENEKGTLFVSIEKDEDKVIITIEDNGVGRKKSMLLNAENKKSHEHLGMKVTNKRIDLLRLINHNKVGFYINDITNEDETGTRVTIALPYYLKFE
jgi:ligand-binding sensor domain-containing protein/two-component sensor histidine kinase